MKFLFLILTASLAYARTDLAGCISSKTRNQWNEASMIWYVPGTGEICDIPDCGGGRAPPKHDNPACPGLYTGTATYQPSYLPGYGPGVVASTPTPTPTATATERESASITADASVSATSEAIGVTAATSSVSVVITSAPSGPTAMKTGVKTGSSSAAATTSGSVAQGTGNGAGMLRANAIGAVAAAVLALAL